LVVAKSNTLVAWSSNQLPESPRAGHSVSAVEVCEDLQASLYSTPGIVVFFTQDSLSMADFTLFGQDSFKNIHNAIENAESFVAYPSVTATGSVTSSLTSCFFQSAKQHNAKLHFIPSSGVSSYDFNSLESNSLNFVAISLPSILRDGSVSEDLLAANDNAVMSALSIIESFSTESLSVLITGSSNLDHFEAMGQISSLLRRGSPSPPPFVQFQPQQFPSATNPAFVTPLVKPVTPSYLYFTIPIFMGVGAFIFIVMFILSGVYGLSLTQTPQRWADPTDKCLPVPLQ